MKAEVYGGFGLLGRCEAVGIWSLDLVRDASCVLKILTAGAGGGAMTAWSKCSHHEYMVEKVSGDNEINGVAVVV